MKSEKFETEYLDYHLTGCFVDLDEKFALIHIFKNASIAIRNALKMRGNYHEWQDVKLNKKIKTLCVIRDPISRFVSAYQYILRLEDGGGFPNRHPVNITRDTKFYKNKNNVIESFLLFLDYVEKNGFYDAVLVPQTHFLLARNLQLEDIDFLFLQENLEEEFELFCKLNSLKNKIKVDNSSPKSKTESITNFINQNNQVKQRIVRMYKQDLILYKDALNLKKRLR